MFRGSRWLALAGVLATMGVAAVALVGPSAAFACSGGTSSVNIYTECVPNAKGGSHPTSGKHTKKPVHHVVTPTQVTPTYVIQTPVHVSSKAKHAINHAGKDKKTLKNIVSNPNLVDATHLKPVLASAPTKADLGSTFDLGTGPTVFFLLLLGTVLVLLGTGGVRSWRNRHRV